MRAELAVVRWTMAATGAARPGRWPTRAAIIVRVARAGAVGFGEAAPLPGFGTDSLAQAHADLARWIATGATPASPSARFAVDTATAWLSAAAAGTTLARRWGAADDRPVAVADVVDDPARAAAAVAAGAPALKVKLDGHGDRARVAAIRAVAPTTALTADVNQRWPLAEVTDRLADLAGLGLAYVEEPAAGLARCLARPLAVPIALDESLASPDRDAWLPAALASGAVAALVLKPTVLGGVGPCQALAALAGQAQVAARISHALEGPVALHAARALAAALAPTAVHGLAAHPGLAAWHPADGTDDDALDDALARLAGAAP
ncbi:MAG: enolase C-terminal domain-like protein [Kofleriaceae bacterium]